MMGHFFDKFKKAEVMSADSVDVFFIFTRGRTGSTAIIDELGTNGDIYAEGEMFRPAVPQKSKEELFDRLSEKRTVHYQAFYKATGDGYASYFKYASDKAKSIGGRYFGFKLLSNHEKSSPGLMKFLKRNNVKAIHLIRRNVIRQVVSGIYAKQSGVYNKRDHTPEKIKFSIDKNEFLMRVEAAIDGVKSQEALLKKNKINYINVYYEDYVSDRISFYTKIFDFLGVGVSSVGSSSFSIMTPKALDETIENFDELIQALSNSRFRFLVDEYYA